MKIYKSSIGFLVCFLLFSGAGISQNKVIDSCLKNELSIHKEQDSTRVNILYALAFSNFQSDLETTKRFLNKAEDLVII